MPTSGRHLSPPACSHLRAGHKQHVRWHPQLSKMEVCAQSPLVDCHAKRKGAWDGRWPLTQFTCAGIAATLGYQNDHIGSKVVLGAGQPGALSGAARDEELVVPSSLDTSNRLSATACPNHSKSVKECSPGNDKSEAIIPMDKIRPLPLAPHALEPRVEHMRRSAAERSGHSAAAPEPQDEAVGWLLRVWGTLLALLSCKNCPSLLHSTAFDSIVIACLCRACEKSLVLWYSDRNLCAGDATGRADHDRATQGNLKMESGIESFVCSPSSPDRQHPIDDTEGTVCPRTEEAMAGSQSFEVPWQVCKSSPRQKQPEKSPPLQALQRSKSPALEEQDVAEFGDIPIFKEDAQAVAKQRQVPTFPAGQMSALPAPSTSPSSLRPAAAVPLLAQAQAPPAWVHRSSHGASCPGSVGAISASFESSTRSAGLGGTIGGGTGTGWGAEGISAASSRWSGSQQSTHLSVATTTASPSWAEKVVIHDRFRWPGVRPDHPDRAASTKAREQGRGGKGSCWRDGKEQAKAKNDRADLSCDHITAFPRRLGHISHTSSWTSTAHSQTSYTSRHSLNSDSLIERINLDLMELEAFEHGSEESG
jgi:hypothetical protein